MKITVPDSKHPRIVVIGAGFAGIHFIKKFKNKPYQIILLDKNNFHQFPPLFYQVATSGLEPDSIVFAIRKMFQQYDNLSFRMGEVTQINSAEKTVHTTIGEISYDHLVIATGSTNNFYGLKDVEQHSLGLKDIQESLDIRSHLLQNMEQAVTSPIDSKDITPLLNVVIVGGGPAGIEMAGALAEFKRYVFKKDYPDVPQDKLQIYLIEASGRLLGAMSEKSQKESLDYLHNLGINVMLNTQVTSYDGTIVGLSGKESIKAKTLLWTAGVKGQFPSGIDSQYIVAGNRIAVDAINQVKGLTNIYAIGDVALMNTEAFPKGHPMVAQTAIQQGAHLAKNIIKNSTKPFKYNDKGSLATIGMKKAVADLNKFHFKGYFAWFIWSTVHLMSISGFRNRLIVGINWMSSYFSYDKSNRLIIRKFKKSS
ncbi:MAG: NAD(P)/FAD-dependent oxidoreductase [Gilvibacter sp.]